MIICTEENLIISLIRDDECLLNARALLANKWFIDFVFDIPTFLQAQIICFLISILYIDTIWCDVICIGAQRSVLLLLLLHALENAGLSMEWNRTPYTTHSMRIALTENDTKLKAKSKFSADQTNKQATNTKEIETKKKRERE